MLQNDRLYRSGSGGLIRRSVDPAWNHMLIDTQTIGWPTDTYATRTSRCQANLRRAQPQRSRAIVFRPPVVPASQLIGTGRAGHLSFRRAAHRSTFSASLTESHGLCSTPYSIYSGHDPLLRCCPVTLLCLPLEHSKRSLDQQSVGSSTTVQQDDARSDRLHADDEEGDRILLLDRHIVVLPLGVSTGLSLP